jgi:hypothetical protein
MQQQAEQEQLQASSDMQEDGTPMGGRQDNSMSPRPNGQ